MNEADRISLHFKYCTVMLVMILVAVITDRWTAQKDFTTYLSNAATLTSLVLGLVAIFYSYISNDGLSKSLGSLITVSDAVRDSKTEIARYVEITKDAVAATETNASVLKGASKDVHGALSTLDSTLKSISDQNEKLQTLVAHLPTRIDQLESKMGDVAKALGEKPERPQAAASSSEISLPVIERFLTRPSLSYNLVTYAFVLAARAKKPVSMESLSNAIELSQPSTMNGFMLGMNAFQLLSRSPVKGLERVFKVTDIHPDLDAKTKPYIDKYIEENYLEGSSEKANWLRKLKNIEELFCESTASDA